VAISRIADLFEKAFRLEYKVGLWIANFAKELLWKSMTILNDETTPLKRFMSEAFSFFWASVEQPVHPFDRSLIVELEAKSIELIEKKMKL
jgi:hypothetical protein